MLRFTRGHSTESQNEAFGEGVRLSVAPRLIGQCGQPNNANTVAFDASQKLIAVGTSDGRIKVQGADGVEALLCSPRHTSTRQISITPHGAVLRLSYEGDIELWSLPEEIFLSCIDGEDIETFTLIDGTPFLVIGTRQGSLRIAQIILGIDESPEELKMLPYVVPVDMLAGSGSIVSLSVQPGANFRILVGFSEGDISLWSLYEKKLIMTGSSDLQVQDSKLVDMTWTGTEGKSFITGYEDGSIWLWNLPNYALPQFAAPAKAEHCVPLCKLQWNAPSSIGKVVSLTDLKCGHTSQMIESQQSTLHIFARCLLESDMYVLLDIQVDEERLSKVGESPKESVCDANSCRNLPWFANVLSFCMVEAMSSTLDLQTNAIIVLSESSTIHAYDVEGLMPFQVDTPVQRYTSITDAVVSSGSTLLGSSMFTRLCANSEISYQTSKLASGDAWPVSGGRPTEMCSSSAQPHEWGMIATGHNDGMVRLWDSRYNSIKLLASFPHQDAPNRSITCIAMSSNLIGVGYDGGEFQVFASVMNAEFEHHQIIIKEDIEKIACKHDASHFACFVKSYTHSASITSIQILVDFHLVACGDDSGVVSVVNIEKGELIFCSQVATKSITNLFVTSRESGNSTKAKPMLCLVVVSADCTICYINLNDPKTSIEVVSPKNLSVALYGAILDKDFNVFTVESKYEMILPGMSLQLKSENISRRGTATENVDVETDSDLESNGSPATTVYSDDGLDNEKIDETDMQAKGTSLLQCSQDYLRIYSLNSISKGDRSTMKKFKTQIPLIYASSVQGLGEECNRHASSVVSIDSEGALSIWELPSFAQIWSRHLADILGWKWSLGNDVKICSSSDGQMLLIDDNKEVVRIGIMGDSRRNPLSSMCLHDKELADATIAATAALMASAAINSPKTKTNLSPRQWTNSLGSIISNATSKVIGPGSPQAAIYPSVQQLHTVFEVPQAPKRVQLKTEYKQTPPTTSTEDSDRKELFSSSNSASKGKNPKRRTVEEIKSAYGRNQGTREKARSAPSEIQGIMAQNMNKLAERGERLSQISQKTQQLENDAEDFLTMAKKLADREKNRKWWDLS